MGGIEYDDGDCVEKTKRRKSHEDLGHFEEAHRRNIQAKFYNEKFH